MPQPQLRGGLVKLRDRPVQSRSCSLILLGWLEKRGNQRIGSCRFRAQGRSGSPGYFQVLARQLTSSAWPDRVSGPVERAARLCTDARLHGCRGVWLPGSVVHVYHPTARREHPTPVGSRRASQVIVVSSVMFTFISYWRTAAIVLCDLASTAYYIGGIVEQAIGPAAPWFILAVMLFSYAVRSVYIESCSLFVRGGVYRVTREALGRLGRQALGLGPDVRLHPHRADQRRLGRAVHHGPAVRELRGHGQSCPAEPASQPVARC